MMRRLVLLLLLVMPATAEATTYYVSKTGSNGDGLSLAAGKTTIAAGIALLSSGDTLLINDGEYNEAIIRNALPSGTGADTLAADDVWPGATIIKAINRRQVVLKALTTAHCDGGAAGSLVWIGNRSFLIFEGLVLDANNVCQQAYRMDYGGTTTNTGSSHHRLLDMEVRNGKGCDCGLITRGSGSALADTTATSPWSHLHIKDSYIHHSSVGTNTFTGNHLVYDYPRNSILETSLFTHSGEACVTNHNRSPNSVIRHNVFYRCGSDPAIAGGTTGTAVILAGINNTAYNNLIVESGPNTVGGAGTAGGGFYLRFGSSGAKVYNNTIWGNTSPQGTCIYLHTDTTKAVVQNNICAGGLNGDVINNQGTGNTLSNNRCASAVGTTCATTANPTFVNATLTPATWDFHLQASSPEAVRLGGTNLSGIFTTDLDGLTRPVGGPWSMGAYDINGTAPGTPGVVFVGAGTRADSNTATVLTPGLPSSLAPSDQCLIQTLGRTAGSAPTWTLPAEWVRLTTCHQTGTNNIAMEIWHKDGTAPTSAPSVSINTIGLGHMAVMACWRNTPGPIAAAASQAAAVATWVPGSVETLEADTRIASFVATADLNQLTMQSAASFTPQLTGAAWDTAGGPLALGLADKTQATAGIVTMPTWQQEVNGPDAWCGATVAFGLIVPPALPPPPLGPPIPITTFIITDRPIVTPLPVSPTAVPPVPFP